MSPGNGVNVNQKHTKMKRFEIEFEVIERSIYSAAVEAETPEEALKLWKENPSDYDSNQHDMIESENIDGSEECTGEWIDDKPDSRFSSLHRFNEPVR